MQAERLPPCGPSRCAVYATSRVISPDMSVRTPGFQSGRVTPKAVLSLAVSSWELASRFAAAG